MIFTLWIAFFLVCVIIRNIKITSLCILYQMCIISQYKIIAVAEVERRKGEDRKRKAHYWDLVQN